jgi:hypothetical protein
MSNTPETVNAEALMVPVDVAEARVAVCRCSNYLWSGRLRVAGYTQYAVHSDVVICGRGTETVNAEALMVPVVMLLEAVVGCLSLFKLSRAVRTFE